LKLGGNPTPARLAEDGLRAACHRGYKLQIILHARQRFPRGTSCHRTFRPEMTLHKRPCDACVLPVSGVARTYRPPSHLHPRGGEAVWTILGALAFGMEFVDDLLAFFQGPVATVLCWQSVVSFTAKYSMLFDLPSSCWQSRKPSRLRRTAICSLRGHDCCNR
jgi:hypothetical protein